MPPLKRLEPYLHIFALSALVIAHPVLELLVKQPEFFAVQQWDLAAIWTLPLALVFLVPLLPASLRAFVGIVRPGTGRWADAFWAALAAGLFTLQLANPSTINLIGDLPTMLVAIAASLFAGWGFFRSQTARSFTTFLAPALVAVPLTFLLNPNIQRLRVELVKVEPSGVQVPAQFPIVFLLFDSLSTTALVDQDLAINPQRFPHLAALAEESTWFPNASSISHWTKESLPALLSGKYPELGKLPRLSDHPQNLFTLLHDSYRFVASDLYYPLCPQQINEFPEEEVTAGERLRSRSAALISIFLHRTFPPYFLRRLPRIDQGWGNFLGSKPEHGPLPQFHAFLEALEPRPEPTLYFHHTIFPHRPYQLLPSGKIFERDLARHMKDGDLRNEGRLPLESEIHLYKEYLFQTGYVDQMIGDLVARLKELDLYDQSLLIVTADHGSRTFPSHLPRDVFSIPLLIKRPHQKEPRIVQEAVSNLDLVPSLIDLLGVESPWQMDGHSFFSPHYTPPQQVFVSSVARPAHQGLDDDRQAMVAWKIKHFGLGEDPLQLFHAGAPVPELLGKPLTEFRIATDDHLQVELELGGPQISYDPASDFIPVMIRGSLNTQATADKPPRLAVSVNGVLEATATALPHQIPHRYRFRFTVPDVSYQSGNNEVLVWMIDPEDPQRLWGPSENLKVEEHLERGAAR